jgi:hypothetical protein
MATFKPRPISEPPQINMSRIEVHGSGGLGMLAIAALMAIALPEIRWFVLLSLACGAATGFALIRQRSRIGLSDPSDDDHTPLLDWKAVSRVLGEKPPGNHARLTPVAAAR